MIRINKILLALAVIFIGAVAGWYAFGSGGGVTLPKLTDFTGTKVNNPSVTTPTPTEDAGSLYRYTEVPYEATGEASQESKGGTATLPGAPTPTVSNIIGVSKVVYQDNGFSPQILTVKVNTNVTFVNESSGLMWVASNPHPTHDILPDFDQKTSVPKNGTYSYTFTKIGTWIYHNHMNPGQTGTVIVKK